MQHRYLENAHCLEKGSPGGNKTDVQPCDTITAGHLCAYSFYLSVAPTS